MPTPDWDRKRAADLGSRALIAAVNDSPDLPGLLDEIEADGMRTVHAVLCGWAGATLRSLKVEPGMPGRPGTDHAMVAIGGTDPVTGQDASLDDMPLTGAQADAYRLLACVGNGDHHMTSAIVNAAAERSEIAPLMAAALVTAVAAVRDNMTVWETMGGNGAG